MTISSFHSLDSSPPPIAGQKVAGGMYADRVITVPITQILYAFTGTAVVLGLIDAPFVHAQSFHRSHLYVRIGKGVFFVYSRSLTELLERLGFTHFLLLHYGLCVNFHLELELDLRSKRKRSGVNVNEKGTEWLVVSRRHVTPLREILGLRPPRRTPKQKQEPGKTLKITGDGSFSTKCCEKN